MAETFRLWRSVWYETNVLADTEEQALAYANGPDSVGLEDELVDSSDWSLADEDFADIEDATDTGDLPTYDQVEAAGLDGTLRTQSGSGPLGVFTWEDLGRHREAQEAELALAGAVDSLKEVLEWAENQEGDPFADYPMGLVPFDEVVADISGIVIKQPFGRRS